MTDQKLFQLRQFLHAIKSDDVPRERHALVCLALPPLPRPAHFAVKLYRCNHPEARRIEPRLDPRNVEPIVINARFWL
jgi:hypothetical protein